MRSDSQHPKKESEEKKPYKLKRYRVKITVLKVSHPFGKKRFTDVNGRLLPLECDYCFPGMEFIVEAEGWKIPEGFPCSWAWDDIYKSVLHMKFGGEFPHGKKEFLTCCTDGIHPVIFKLERLDE